MFMQILKKVQATDEWAVMNKTVENSPYHREANVAVHTMMTLGMYEEHFASKRTERQRMLTRVALLFHDFGKPDAEETLTNDDGSTRRRYAGHELISANSFVDFVQSHEDIRQALYDADINDYDIRAIRFMIEHHLPYSLKKQNKVESLKFNLAELLGDDLVCFYDMLESDCRGRISDDHPTKIAAVEDWIASFKQVPIGKRTELDPSKPSMIITMGTSGSGKSTWSKEMAEVKGHTIFSLDLERVKFAEKLASTKEQGWLRELEEVDPRGFYDVVYNLATGPNKAAFKQFANANYLKLLDEGKNVIVDNMNVSKKGRAFFINEARQRGYNIASAEFSVPLQTVIDRQATREGKSVPIFAVKQAYFAQQLPFLAHTYTNLKNGKTVVNDYGEVDIYLNIQSH